MLEVSAACADVAPEVQLRCLFDIFDVDGNGELDVDEVQAISMQAITIWAMTM